LIALALLAACGGGSSPHLGGDAPADSDTIAASEGHSGTRLKLAWLDTPDGIHQVTTTTRDYFDAQLGDDCRAEVWADGKTHCTPDAPGVMYADAGCTQQRLLSRTPLPKYVVHRDLQNLVVEAYVPGAAITGSQYWELRADGMCYGPYNTGLANLWELTHTDFVELTDEYVGPGPLQQKWRSSSDGFAAAVQEAFDTSQGVEVSLRDAGLPIVMDPAPSHRLKPYLYSGSGISLRTGFFHDSMLDLDCYLSRLGCLPSPTATPETFYTDAGCTAAVDVVRKPNNILPPQFARDTNGIYPIVGPYPAALWNKIDTGCDPTSFEFSSSNFYELGTLMPLSVFEQATYSIDP
jgi:hypothetical protein